MPSNKTSVKIDKELSKQILVNQNKERKKKGNRTS